MHHQQRALGAAMNDHYGWEVVEQFTSADAELRHVREGVGLADTSWLGKWDVKGAGVDDTSWTTDHETWRLAHGHWLVTYKPQEAPAVREELEREAAATDCFHVTDVTSVYAAFLLVGRDARAVLNKLTALDVSETAMPNLSCGQTELARVHAIVLRQDFGDLPTYCLLVGREHGEYVWDAVMHAGLDFGIVPFGLIALRVLEGGD